MSLDEKGNQTDRGQKPEKHSGQGNTAHHMISQDTLRKVWNAMNGLEAREHQQRYLEVIGFGSHGDIDRVLAAADAQTVLQMGQLTRDQLDSSLSWQDFNLFQGPANQFRPPHSPDPKGPGEIVKFFEKWNVTFDFPIVGPPHGRRAKTLFDASLVYRQFIEAASKGSPSRNEMLRLREAIESVSSVSHLPIIPRHDVNWFAVSQPLFVIMSPKQRQELMRQYHDAPRDAKPDANDLARQIIKST
ncbi:MAG: hypothetical protein AAF958_06485 [Planctomycetota bacterium]